MLACDFPQRNGILGKPDEMTDEQCYGLPVHRYVDSNGHGQIISCWRPSKEDLEEIQRTGQIWVSTIGMRARLSDEEPRPEEFTLTPFCLMAESPFHETTVVLFEPTPGDSIQETCIKALALSDRVEKPVDFSFNGVRIRVYPGKKVAPEAYEEYYKAACLMNHWAETISAANGK